MEYEFFVPGEAKTAGSKKGFPVKKSVYDPVGQRWVKVTKFNITHDNPQTKVWMDSVKWFAMKQFGRPCLMTGPVELILIFYRDRPMGHFGTGRNKGILKAASRLAMPVSKPDSLKLGRAVEDALTGIIYKDDSQVCHHDVWKFYCTGDEKPGVKIIVRELQFKNNHAETMERQKNNSQLKFSELFY